MKPDDNAPAGIVVPGVASLVASSRRTLKQGDTFALFDEFGDVPEVERSPTGIFHRDTRHLSRLLFSVEGHQPLVLSSSVQLDNVTLDVDLTNPDMFLDGRLILAKDTFHVARSKFLWDASCYELFAVTNYGDRRRRLRLAIDFDADFADLFEIRGFTRLRRGAIRAHLAGRAEACFDYAALDGVPRRTRICFGLEPVRLSERRAEFELDLGARERRGIPVTLHCDHGGAVTPERRYFTVRRRARRALAAARAESAAIETSSPVVNSVLARSSADLAMLMADTPQGPYPYAGVPWFSTAFGRDGILTAMQMLSVEPQMARGVLGLLAAHQATREDPAADAEPGKILHEMRECELAHLGEVPFGRYYGSVDSTPLFVALAGMYWQRTRDSDTLCAIWPNVKAALDWIDRYGDRDGDGFVEYDRKLDTGLRNQGWKDSDDSVFHADGRLARAPIALCEVQGYVYLAKRLGAALAADMHDRALAIQLNFQADQLRAQFEEKFWCEHLGTYALALDAGKAPCQVRTSNAGQVLFTGIAAPARAARVAEALVGAEFFTGWGVRTLSTREIRFNPASYHNGSVWPHDNALIALGLARCGHTSAALRITGALFDAAAHMHLRRLPELFCGFPRRPGKPPTLYPVACAPQAWAAAAPVALLQACLGLEVDSGAERVRLHRPRLPHFIDWMTLRGLQVGTSRLDLMFRRHESGVAVSLLSREGAAEIEVML